MAQLTLLYAAMLQPLVLGIVGGIALLFILGLILFLRAYRKVPQGKVMVRTGFGGTKVSFNGMFVFPVIHKLEVMDISVKSVEISRMGKDGLICQDNMRADIKVVFFVRVNPTVDDVKEVAMAIGCDRASEERTLVNLFDAKFSEALKTVGKQFQFVELYNSRERFKKEILQAIGKDLNGYVLDDAAIDYLEQTPLEFLKQDNILDAEGIKKIAELTAQQHILANQIRREEQKVIKKQDVEAQEAILQLDRQLAEKEEIQKREIASIKAREEAETKKIQQEERLRFEQARISTEEELAIAEENKSRQVIVAQKAKERTDAVETERVTKDKELEVNERERVVALAQIEKEKALEVEKKNIQDVIRERVVVERATVEEEEKIKDTRAFKEADRQKNVVLTQAEQEAGKLKIMEVTKAEAEKESAKILAERKIIDADASLAASEREAEAKKKLAEARAAEEATIGLAEAQVMEAKAEAREREGAAEANVLAKMAEAKEIAGTKEASVLEKKATAEAAGKEALADANRKQGLVDAEVLHQKLSAEAKGIDEKAAAMKKLDGVGKEHEEFRLRLQKDKEVELAQIQTAAQIAEQQALVLAEAMKNANIDIVGGETMFFDKIMGAIAKGKAFDAMIDNSSALTGVKNNLLSGGEDGNMIEKIRELIDRLGISSNDIKNLSIASLILKMNGQTQDGQLKGMLNNLLDAAVKNGIADKPASILGL